MKQVKLSTGEYLLVEVPEDAHAFSTHWVDVQKLVYSSEIQDPLKCGGDMERLPPGNWQIIGKASELSEYDWKGIVNQLAKEGVEGYETGVWKNYRLEKSKYGGLNFRTATESGLSLIASHQMKPETTLILKNVV